MSGTSRKTRVVAIRLSNATVERIEAALITPRCPAESVGDFCQRVIERWVYRHDRKLKPGEAVQLKLGASVPLSLSRSTKCATLNDIADNANVVKRREPTAAELREWADVSD